MSDYLPVIPAKAGIQRCGAPAVPPCYSQGQALNSCFRGGDGVFWTIERPG
jgi:hypothetical protein